MFGLLTATSRQQQKKQEANKMQQPQELNDQCQNCILNIAHCTGTPNGNCHKQIKPKEQKPIATPTNSTATFCQYCKTKLEPNTTKCSNCGAPIKEAKTLKWLPECLVPKRKIKILDYTAGIITLIIWLVSTAWITQSYPITYALIIILAVFWLGFIVVFRLMIGGILD